MNTYKTHLRTGKVVTLEAQSYMAQDGCIHFYDADGNFLTYPTERVMKVERV